MGILVGVVAIPIVLVSDIVVRNRVLIPRVCTGFATFAASRVARYRPGARRLLVILARFPRDDLTASWPNLTAWSWSPVNRHWTTMKVRHDRQSPSSVCTWPPRTRNLPPYFSTVPGPCFRYSSNPAESVTSLSTTKYTGTRGPPHHAVASSRSRPTSRLGGCLLLRRLAAPLPLRAGSVAEE